VLTATANTHLNLIDSSRQLFELDPGAAIERAPGWVLGAGTASHPVISNAAFRVDDNLDPGELIAHAREFFAARNRGFAVWARDVDADRDLTAAAEAARLTQIHAAPEMVLHRRAETHPLPAGAELHRVESAADTEDYWRVAASAYASNGFPPEVFGHYTDHDGLRADDVAAFLIRLDGQAASIAMTLVSHGVAGIYWVGSTAEARGRGLGWAVTAAAVNAGFDFGAELAALQASPMGEKLYLRMGFEKTHDYRLLLCRPPEASR
jgi:Acetyltransferase (GNAT) domain